MPDKPTQDWTDDAAFWDEAWNDMEQRLDAEERQRPVWWYWVAGALVALLFAAGWWYGTSETSVETEDRNQPAIATAADSPAPYESKSTRPQQEAAAPTITHATGTTGRAVVPRPAAPAAPGEAVSRRNRVVSPIARASRIQQVAAPAASNISFRVGSPAGSVAALPRSFLTSIPGRDLNASLPGIAVAKGTTECSRLRFGAELALSSAGASYRPGYRTGGFMDWQIGRRLSTTVALRYRHDEWEAQVAKGATFYTREFTSSEPNPVEVASLLNQELNGRALNRLEITGPELLVGVSWKLTERFHLSAGLGSQQTLNARGPLEMSVSEDGVFTARYSGSPSRLGFEETELARFIIPANNGPTPESYPEHLITIAEGPSGSVLRESFNQQLFRASFGVEFGLSRRLSLSVGYERLLNPLYKNGSLRTGRGQFTGGVTLKVI